MPGTVQLVQLKEVLTPMSTEAVCLSCTLLLFTREHTDPLQQCRVGCVVENVREQVMPESLLSSNCITCT